jgi:hypothetical protein
MAICPALEVLNEAEIVSPNVNELMVRLSDSPSSRNYQYNFAIHHNIDDAEETPWDEPSEVDYSSPARVGIKNSGPPKIPGVYK